MLPVVHGSAPYLVCRVGETWVGFPSATVDAMGVEEIDAIIGLLKEKKRNGHFRGLWETYEDAVKLMERGGVVVQSIFSPAITKLRRSAVATSILSTPLPKLAISLSRSPDWLSTARSM